MEKKKEIGVKMGDVVGSPSFPFSSVFDFSYNEVEKSSLGFMELLGVQDYSPLLHDLPQLSTTMSVPQYPSSSLSKDPSETTNGKDCSEVLNQHQPPTPNSSSISSASTSEPGNDEHNRAVDQSQEEHHKTKKQLLKAKKTNQKRQKEPRFAFMTKSEVDHLEDGYRWRKYGQKAVKNSPFPRSYYRCTSASCNVKKRVERSFTDPSVVVTTYEGQHTHPSPVMPRPSGLSATNSGSVMPGNYLGSQYHHQHLLVNTMSSLGFPRSDSNNTTKSPQETPRLCNPAGSTTTTAFLRDHGLLEDVVPSHMLKEE